MNWKQRYRQSPEFKARQKVYNAKYRSRPEIKKRARALASLSRWREQYERLISLYKIKKGDLPKWQLLRLGALSECFRKEFEKPRMGDLNEWTWRK